MQETIEDPPCGEPSAKPEWSKPQQGESCWYRSQSVCVMSSAQWDAKRTDEERECWQCLCEPRTSRTSSGSDSRALNKNVRHSLRYEPDVVFSFSAILYTLHESGYQIVMIPRAK